MVAAEGLGERVVFTGFVSEEELDNLFRMSDLLIYPSLYEGFGIPVLEAMKLGVPVITSSTTALPEVAGEAALLVDPEDTEDMAGGMSRILVDRTLNETLRQKGKERARGFTWEKNGETYLEVYEQLAALTS
jgi:glycosyltransferase involved in cell wall biosynthesis